MVVVRGPGRVAAGDAPGRGDGRVQPAELLDGPVDGGIERRWSRTSPTTPRARPSPPQSRTRGVEVVARCQGVAEDRVVLAAVDEHERASRRRPGVWAMAAPMPRAAPVTTATLSVMLAAPLLDRPDQVVGRARRAGSLPLGAGAPVGSPSTPLVDTATTPPARSSGSSSRAIECRRPPPRRRDRRRVAGRASARSRCGRRGRRPRRPGCPREDATALGSERGDGVREGLGVAAVGRDEHDAGEVVERCARARPRPARTPADPIDSVPAKAACSPDEP